MSIVAALDKVLFFNASSKYSVLRMKTEDSSVPTEARSPYRYCTYCEKEVALKQRPYGGFGGGGNG